MRVPASPAVMIGSAALGAAVVLLGTVVGRSVLSSPSAEPVATAALASVDVADEPEVRERIELEPTLLREAVDAAPFDPSRTPPAERYRMPGEQVFFAEMPVPERELEPPPAFELLGTAASRDGGLAIIRLESETPQFVSTGETVNGYRVVSIDAGRVTMTNDERTLSLSVASASPTPPAREQNGRNNRRRDNDDDDQPRRAGNPAANRMAEQAAAINAQMQRIQNLPPEERAAAIRQLQGRLQQQGNGAWQIQVDGNRMRVIGTQVEGIGGGRVVEETVVRPPVFRATPARQ